MMRAWSPFVMPVVMVALASCAAAPRVAEPIAARDPGKVPQLVIGPYAVTPPGAPWRPAAGAVGATFVHEESSAQHTMAIRILPVVPPDDARDPALFEENARFYNEDRLDPGKQRILAQNYVPVTVNGLSCIAYNVDGADTGLRDGVSVPFAIVGQLCRHPWHPDWIDVSVSERGGEGGIRADVRAAGAKVLQSLRNVRP